MLDGGVIEKPGTSTENKTGDWRTDKPIVDYSKCIKCGICWMYCPDNAIKWENGLPVWDFDYCKGCGICAQECPAKAITMVREEK
ncbi:MAG TPA: 4Fe-4S dicluster domain-containing protein [Candidatus Aenigmarchaeota archaeon]|nr:MAG: pyruvate synthase [Nanoarchaeota archaeon]HDO79834.1 4Fe-4S dicluster domain-containing protein [Candidatus Aenigmarchaeota archaeon]HEX32886.1 4Fe-4S dicluster domain-containing protein [Candidatus Aenigmarchaeota archaeon]